MGNELSFLGPFSFIEPLNKIVFTFNCIFHSIGNTMTFDCIGENKGGNYISMYRKHGAGHIFILPTPKNPEEFIDFFIEKIMSSLDINFEVDLDENEAIPEEIAKIEIVGQQELSIKIQQQKDKIIKEEESLKKLEQGYKELDRWKDLIWQTGNPLENIVKKFFSEMGIELQKQEVDLVGEYKGKELFVEVKGNTNCINHSKDFRQIHERKFFNAKNPLDTFALLVGNPFRLEPLNNRPPQNNSLFAETSIKIAEEQKIGLIPTIQLFYIINDLLGSKKFDKSKILDDIINCSGVYSYKK